MSGRPYDARELLLLPSLWNEKNEDGGNRYTCNEIGVIMGRHTSSVIGKAHRLSLPPRESPIRKRPRSNDQPVAWNRWCTPVGATLPPLASEVPEPIAFELFEAPLTTPLELAPRDGCRWTESHGRPWLFCEATAIEGRPYCAKHCQVAYRPYQPREAVA